MTAASTASDADQTLTLAYSDLSGGVPQHALAMIALRVLNLSHCHLAQIPDEIASLKQLRVLSATHNELTALPAALSALISLEELLLSHNELEAAGVDAAPLHALPRLKMLALSHNSLDEVPQTVLSCKGLESLTLSNNGIAELPPGIGELRNLKHLALSATHLSELCPQICQLPKLKSLSIANNVLMEHEPPELLSLRISLLVVHVEGSSFASKRRELQSSVKRISRLRFSTADLSSLWTDDVDKIVDKGAGGGPLPSLQTMQTSFERGIERLPSSPMTSSRRGFLPVAAPPPKPRPRCYSCSRDIAERELTRQIDHFWHRRCWEEYEELVPMCEICNEPIFDSASLEQRWHPECFARSGGADKTDDEVRFR